MISLWDDEQAAAFADDDLAMRVYTSRLLGSAEDLVLHGGGNTSVKSTISDFFGDPTDVLFVKGSGWDLKTIEAAGFPAVRLHHTRRLAELEALSDTDMTRQLRALMLDPSGPSPSVEAILHAIIPRKFVDHTHADAVVTLSNNPAGENILAELYPDCLILPYVMPGFILSKQVDNALRDFDLAACKGIILMHHGVFTFADDARTAYENMIGLVTRAENYAADRAPTQAAAAARHPLDLLDLARIRREVSRARGAAQLALLDDSAEALDYASRDDVAEISTRGPITPDHVIRTKRVPAVISIQPEEDVQAIARFASQYRSYFERHAAPGLRILDQAPRFAIWRNRGTITFGSNSRECDIVSDIVRHTCRAVQVGEALGGWKALPEKDIFDLEYWELEQAKLGKDLQPGKPHQGKVALVTGAFSGIGRATCEALVADGAAVVGLDINPEMPAAFNKADMHGIICDVTDGRALKSSVDEAVRKFGGLDVVVANAGIFHAGETIDELSPDSWEHSIAVNLTATQRLASAVIPYLKLGIEPSLLLVGSRNVSAPGPGAGAYSVSKAGVTQLGRVAALELAPAGVRVNVVHPDAVFDTALWTDETLQRSASRYGMSVAEYKRKNLLGLEIRAADVGRLLSTLAGRNFRATTGAQIPVDGGSDRVI